VAGPKVLSLAGDSLAITGASQLKQELVAALGSDREIVLEAAGAEAIDTAGLQLVAAFMQEAQRQRRVVSWRGVGADLQTKATRLGLVSALHLP